MPVGGGNCRRRLRRADGAPGATAGPYGGVQEEAGCSRPQGDLARLRHRMAHADRSTGLTLLMKIQEIRAFGLYGCTPEGGWSNELQPEDCVHTIIAVLTDDGRTGWGS